MSLRMKRKGGMEARVRNNYGRDGRPTFFQGLVPLANAIAALPRANLADSTPRQKLGAAQRKRERKAAALLAQQARTQQARQ
jgi:hypothetical protein